MGLDKQTREILDSIIDNKLKECREIRLISTTFKEWIKNDIDFTLGIIIGEISSSFEILFTILNRRVMSSEEKMETYHVIRSRLEEFYDVLTT